MKSNMLSTQHFVRQVKNLGIIASLLLAAVVILGVNLFIQIRHQNESVRVDYWLVQRPVLQLQREILRLLALVHDVEVDGDKIRLQSALVQSRITIIQDILNTSIVPDPDITDTIMTVEQTWLILQIDMNKWEQRPNDSNIDRELIYSNLRQMEIDLNTLNTNKGILNEQDFRYTTATNQQILLLMSGIAAFLILFVGIVALSTYRFILELQHTQLRLLEFNNELELRVALRTQELAEVNDKLTKLNRDKDKFFSLVAHDLKGPFMPLLGNAEILADSGHELEPLQIKDMGQSIQRSAKNMLALLENLLQWAQLQMGRMRYQPQRLDLFEIAANNIELLSSNATYKQIKLVNEVAIGTWIYADKNMVDTIIRNLTNNALKFTPQGGQVTIAAQLGMRNYELRMK